MKKFILMAFAAIASLTVYAQATVYDWNGIDTLTVNQQVSFENAQVYVYGTSKAQFKEGNAKKIAKQQEAVDEMSQTLVDYLKKEYKNTTFQTVSDPSQVPIGGILVKACFTEMNWGSKAARFWVGAGVGNMHGKYIVQVYKDGNLSLELRNHRFHDTQFASENGAKVIKVYFKAMTKDLITALKK